MGLLENFSQYAAYFHDGDLYSITQTDSELVIFMESCQISPEDMKDNIQLSNFSTIRGKLHLSNVKCIFENGTLIKRFEKVYDIGDIYDFNVTSTSMEILITWKVSAAQSKKQTDMIEYKFMAENIYWENLPTINDPTITSIEDLQNYFIGGTVAKIKLDNDELYVFSESKPIPTHSNRSLTPQNTLKGALEFLWVKNICVDKEPITSLEPITGTGRISNLHIGYHEFQMDIDWESIADNTKSMPQQMTIEGLFGAVEMRPLFKD